MIATVARVIGAPPDAVAAVLADARSNDGVVVGSKRIRWFDARWPSRERSSTDGDPPSWSAKDDDPIGLEHT